MNSPAAAVASSLHAPKGRVKRGAAKRRQSARPTEVTYTCPMHHDVHEKAPGECPKCGMDLEAEKRVR